MTKKKESGTFLQIKYYVVCHKENHGMMLSTDQDIPILYLRDDALRVCKEFNGQKQDNVQWTVLPIEIEVLSND